MLTYVGHEQDWCVVDADCPRLDARQQPRLIVSVRLALERLLQLPMDQVFRGNVLPAAAWALARGTARSATAGD